MIYTDILNTSGMQVLLRKIVDSIEQEDNDIKNTFEKLKLIEEDEKQGLIEMTKDDEGVFSLSK